MPDAIGQSSQTSDGPGAQAQEKAKEVAGQAQEKAQDARAEASKQLARQVDQRSTQAGERRSAAPPRTCARSRRAAWPARARVNRPDTPSRPSAIERAGDWLRDSDGDAILRDVEGFARRNRGPSWPAVSRSEFAASRLLKASRAAALPILALERLRNAPQPGQPGTLHPDGVSRDRDGGPAGTGHRHAARP